MASSFFSSDESPKSDNIKVRKFNSRREILYSFGICTENTVATTVGKTIGNSIVFSESNIESERFEQVSLTNERSEWVVVIQWINNLPNKALQRYLQWNREPCPDPDPGREFKQNCRFNEPSKTKTADNSNLNYSRHIVLKKEVVDFTYWLRLLYELWRAIFSFTYRGKSHFLHTKLCFFFT